MHQYALDFFRKKKVAAYHLRVAPTNQQAINFYLKNGKKMLGEEHGGKVIRMKGNVQA